MTDPTEPSATPIRDTLRRLFARPPLPLLPPEEYADLGALVWIPKATASPDQGDDEPVG